MSSRSQSPRADGSRPWTGELIAAGAGLFTGALAIHGAIDNGSHAVEVIATQGEYEDSKPAMCRRPRLGRR